MVNAAVLAPVAIARQITAAAVHPGRAASIRPVKRKSLQSGSNQRRIRIRERYGALWNVTLDGPHASPVSRRTSSTGVESRPTPGFYHDDEVRAPGDGEGSRAFYQNALLRLSRLSVKGGRTAEDVMREAGDLVSSTLQLARIGIWFLIDEGRAIRCAFLYQRGRLEAYEGTILHATDFPGYFQAIADSRSVAVFDSDGDGLADEFREAYLAPLGISSMLDVPIYRGGRVAGIICHEHVGPPRRWTELEREFATSVGDITGRLWKSRRASARSRRSAATRPGSRTSSA